MSPERDPPVDPFDEEGDALPEDPLSILEQYERTYCDCAKCTAACKHMPGSLAPGDFERIATFTRSPPDEKFLEEFFRASDGPLVRMFHDDGTPEDLHIPTLVPRQEEDGRCVFLDERDRCIIHPVSPFGCRMYKVCDPPTQEDDEKSANMLRQILKVQEYLGLWKHLVERGLFVKPLLERRHDLILALKSLKEDSS